MQRRFASLLLFALVTISLWAQTPEVDASLVPVPPLVKFSGTISSAPAGTVGVIFALYKDQTGGAPLWQEVQNVTTDASGRYSAFLGARSASGIPLEVFSNGEARWLGVQPEGQPEQARVLLVSVPYALKASDSETLGGLPASAFLRADAVTATASSTAPAAYVNTAAVNSAANRAAAAAISASSAKAGYLPVFTDGSGDLQNSALFQLNAGTTAAPVWNLGFGTVAPAFNLNFVSQVDPAAIAIDGYGAVGINFIGRRAEGTLAAPSAILSGDNIMAMQGRGYGATKFSTSSRAYMKFFAAENWTDAAQGTYISLATTPTGTAAAAERLRITAAGNVGIGTTAPAYPLSVNGVIQSSAGGFRFPDNTVQTTAAVGGGAGVTLSSPDGSITVGGTGTAPTVKVNSSVIQARVSGTCSSGYAVASIKQDGTVTCQVVGGGGGGDVNLVGNNNFVGQETVTGPSTANATAVSVTSSAPTGTTATYPASAIMGTATDNTGSNSAAVSAIGVNGSIGLYGTSDNGLGLDVANSDANIDGQLRQNGLFESGNEDLAAPPDTPCASSCPATPSVPYNGMVIRRFKSAYSTAGTVVAIAQVDNTNPRSPAGVSLQRDGTNDGFILVTDASLTAGIPLSYSCQGATSQDNPLDTHGTFVSPTQPSQTVYPTGSGLISFHCVFGRLADAANMTDVTLTRFNANSPIWIGTIISDSNQ
jgi:hypothetical protein